MLTRVILAAGVAALAISAPATAQRGERGDRAAKIERGGGGERAQRPQRAQRAERAPRVQRQQRLVQRAERRERAQRPARFEREQRVAQRAERRERVERPPRIERQQRAAQRLERGNLERRQVRTAERRELRQNRVDRIERQQLRAERQQARANRIERQQIRADRQQARVDRIDRLERRQLRADRLAGNGNRGVGYGVGGCPPGLESKGCVPPGQQTLGLNWARLDERRATRQALRATRLAALDNRIVTQFIEPVRVRSFIGSPLSSVAAFTSLAAVPGTISYLYPDTDDYYYRYGGGYMYRVDRDDDLISWVLPLIAGGFMPGQYLPASYMSSYVPSYYGFNSFYPDSPYDCNRYANGVIYEVDCVTGLIEDVNPLYASGYGVGQYLPASYGYYNVPYQYRSLYYNTPDYNYWYAPGAIYQVDPGTSLITAVASLLSPGLTIGQPLPMGYNVYNVPYAYRSTYYDTPNAWYRYNNGYIYQIDPTTQLVTAIVASILT